MLHVAPLHGFAAKEISVLDMLRACHPDLYLRAA
jgi:hypothetical protein